MKNKPGVAGAIAAVLIGGGYAYWSAQNRGDAASAVSVKLPAAFTSDATAGRFLFEANCAKCHGKNAAGTDSGPPLVHIIYEPGHHGDISFYRAAQFGTRAHHWRFGDMPAIKTVAQTDVAKIITYVRELQRANGIN